jgi:hypothetical protein
LARRATYVRREGKPTRPRERERVKSQPDRLRCNWRAHYLVLSHRDNYPRGRFRAPGLGLKVRRRDRRAEARRFTKYSDFFQARQRERASPPGGRQARAVAAYDGRPPVARTGQWNILCAVLLRFIWNIAYALMRVLKRASPRSGRLLYLTRAIHSSFLLTSFIHAAEGVRKLCLRDCPENT